MWPRVLNAQVVAAEGGAPTCFPAEGTARCLDYALVSQGLAPLLRWRGVVKKGTVAAAHRCSPQAERKTALAQRK
eukprot:8345815-Pyramimonas_sp.AAC.1